MSISEIFMFVYKGSEESIVIDKTILEKITGLGTIPLLWNRDGEYRLVPKEVVQNAIDTIKTSSKLYSDKCSVPQVAIWWDQGIPVSNQVGRTLVGE